MATVNGESGFTQQTKLNVTQKLLVGGEPVSASGTQPPPSTINSSSYAISSDDTVLMIDYTTVGPVTLTLPSAIGIDGKTIIIKDSGQNASINNITINTTGSETIDGQPSASLFLSGNSFIFISDGSNWFQIARAFLTRDITRSYALSDIGGSNSAYLAGFYRAPVSSVTLTIGGTVTQNYGTANIAYAAHAFAVASGSGGSGLVLTVSGTSIDDDGVRTTSDSEIVVSDTSSASTNSYFETQKKWLGEITYTLSGASGAFTFNYGLAKYEDFSNRNFTIEAFEVVGLARNSEANFDVELIHHQSSGWTYSASSFVPGNTAIAQLSVDYSTDDQINANQPFAYKRTNLSESVEGSLLEGVVIRFTAATNNSVRYADCHLSVQV